MRVDLDGGTTIELGTTETTPTIGITDYSRRVTDDFGVTTVVQRGFARRLSVRLAVPFDQVDALQRRLADLRATAATWVADERYDWLSARGFYKDFSLDLRTSPLSLCTLSIEGLAETEPGADAGGDPAPDGQASSLRLLQPVVVTDAVLAASNVAENDAPAWAAGTSYAIGARVIKGHRVYENATDGNVGNDPTGPSGKWIDVGPTNRWAMFDGALGSVTSAAGSIVVTLASGTAGALALLDVTGATVRVQAQTYDRTIAVGPGAITFLDLPGAGGHVIVTIAGPGQVSVGTLLVGNLVALGLTEASPTAAITDYSRKEVDDFGAVTVVQRAWAKRMTAKALIRTDAIDTVANRIAAVRARPSLWIGQAGVDSLTVYGFFKDFSIEVGESTAKLSLSIEGLSAAAKVAPLKTTVDWPDVGDPDGTKPEDGATYGSPAGSPIGDRSAQDVIDSLDINVGSILEQALRQDDLLAVFDGRTLVEGQPVGAKFVDFRTKAENPETGFASASDFRGIFAKTEDGAAWNINLDALQVAPNKTFATRLSEIGAVTDDATVSVKFLQDVFVGDGQANAKVIMRAEANGVLGAYSISADGITRRSSFKIVADELVAVDPNNNDPNGAPIQIFSYGPNNKLRLWDVEVDKLKINTAVVPVRVSAASDLPGTFTDWPNTAPQPTQTALTASVLFPVAGYLEVMVSAKQHFTRLTDSPWVASIVIDGSEASESLTFGTVPGDQIVALASRYVSAGWHNVQLRWNGASDMILRGRSMFVKGYPYTE